MKQQVFFFQGFVGLIVAGFVGLAVMPLLHSTVTGIFDVLVTVQSLLGHQIQPR